MISFPFLTTCFETAKYFQDISLKRVHIYIDILAAPVAVCEAHHDQEEDEQEEEAAGDPVDEGRGHGHGDRGVERLRHPRCGGVKASGGECSMHFYPQ